MTTKEQQLTRIEQIDVILQTSLEILREKKELNLGLQIMNLSREKARKELIEDEIRFLQSFQCGRDRKYLDIENRIKDLKQQLSQLGDK